MPAFQNCAPKHPVGGCLTRAAGRSGGAGELQQEGQQALPFILENNTGILRMSRSCAWCHCS